MTTLSRASTLTPCESPAPPDIPVQPDHFYGSRNVQLPLSPHSDGRTWLDPADDPLAQRGIPVFKPTMEEFQDFEGYMNKVECWGNRSGIVKVIPPKQWTDALPSIKDQLAEVKIKSPIEQLMFGDRGLFRQQNMEKRKWMSVREWVELCSKEDFKAPSIREVGLASRTAPAIPRPRIQRRGKRKADSAISEASPASEEVRVKEEPEPQRLSEELPVEPQTPPVSEGSTTSRKVGSRKKTKQEAKDEAKPRPKRVHPSREAREASLADRAARDRAFIDVFDPQAAWLPPDTNSGDYTPEFCQQLERRFWRGLGFGGKPAWYGADTQGSLFTDATTSWNVAHLPSALSRLLPSSSKGLPGVNTPYLYFGMWRATFAWHVEDMDLFSINYIHFGAPKFWYAIPQGRATGLEQAMRSYFPKDTSQCSQFLRHKSFLASPSVLAKDACKPNHLVQKAGEFVITFPRGYHAGFNLGLNCAESVNFALESWIELGRKAKACGCVNDSVRIDVDQLLKEREEERSDPAHSTSTNELSAKEVAGVDSQDDALSPSSKPSSRKRKLDDVSTRGKKKPKVSDLKSGAASSAVSSAKGQTKITLKLGPRSEEQESFPCCLCVSMSREGLLRVQNPPFARKDAAEAAGHPKVWLAHEFCANVVPETWVDNSLRADGNVEKVVYGVDGIVKDRWNLKCSACSKTRQKMHGAPVQCTKGKCAKAFHVNCAKDGHAQGILLGVLREVDKEVISLNNVPVSAVPRPSALGTDENHMSLDAMKTMQQHDSSESVFKVVKKLEVQILCTQHNPAVAAQKKASKQDKIRNELMALPSMSRIKIRVSAGVFEVSLIRVIEETGSVEVLWDQNIKKEFKWGSVVLGNTDTPIQHRPSETLATSKRDVPSAVLVATHLSTPATLNQPKIDFQAGGSSSRTDNQSSSQTTVSMGLKPQLFVSGNRVVYPASFNYGQWPNHHVGATPYGVSAVQNSLPFPYSAYYGAPANPMVVGSGSHQNHSYGQQQSYNGSTVMSTTQLQGSNPTDQAMSSTTNIAEASSQDTASVFHLPHATADQPSNTSSPQSNTAQGMQALQPSALLNGQNPVWDATADDSTMTSRGPNQPPEPSTIDPSTLSLEPAQLAEILRANPGLASVVLAALGQTQSRV